MAKLRILVVDDDKINLESIREDLEDNFYEVVEAHSGEQAMLILLKDQSYNAVLLDRMMPGMDGMEVLKLMKENKKLKHIPVILQTAVVEVKEMVRGYDNGCYHYITKPFSKVAMLEILDKAITKARYENATRKKDGK